MAYLEERREPSLEACVRVDTPTSRGAVWGRALLPKAIVRANIPTSKGIVWDRTTS